MTLSYYREIVHVTPNHFCYGLLPVFSQYTLINPIASLRAIISHYLQRADIRRILARAKKMKLRIDTLQNPAIPYFFYNTNRYKQILCDLSIFE
jgi:hypothetical protein